MSRKVGSAAAISTSDGTATPAEIASFVGAPNDAYTDLGAQSVTYDLGTYRLINGAGQDFNIYEVDFGAVEFHLADILVSANGTDYFNVESSFLAAVDLAGDEAHTSAGFRRSYDLGGAAIALGASAFRYVRVDGTGTGPISGSDEFDLDAFGGINFIDTAIPSAVPEPSTRAMMLAGFGLVGGSMRRRRRLELRTA